MSGAYSITRPRELVYELVEDEEQRRERALKLELVYAAVDPQGWDARRLAGAAGGS